jgi:hypothetical protein
MNSYKNSKNGAGIVWRGVPFLQVLQRGCRKKRDCFGKEKTYQDIPGPPQCPVKKTTAINRRVLAAV